MLICQGELGDGTREPASAPVPVTGNLTFSAIAAGVSTACGIAKDGAAYCCERTLLLKTAHLLAEPAVACCTAQRSAHSLARANHLSSAL